MSRIFRSGEKNSHSAAIQAHTTPIQSVARMPSGAPQGTADQPAERQRARHDPADGRVHPTEQIGRADQLPVAELSDVVDDEREGESGQRDREQDQPRTALGQRHENRDQAEHADRDPDDPGRPDQPGEPPRQHAAHDPAQAAEAEEQASVRGLEAQDADEEQDLQRHRHRAEQVRGPRARRDFAQHRVPEHEREAGKQSYMTQTLRLNPEPALHPISRLDH